MNKADRDSRNGMFVIAFFLFILAIGLYFNTLDHEFVFDDHTLILQNPLVFELDVKGMVSGSGYRPVRGLTYILNYYLGGENPLGYHLFNVLLHGINVILLLIFVFSLTRSSRIAGLAGLVFCIHPVQTASVAYVSGRKDLLALCFLLLGLLLFMKFREGGSKLCIVLSFLAFVLSVASKEVAIVFPVLLVLVDAVMVIRDSDPAVKNRLFESVRTAYHRSKWQYLCFGAVGIAALAVALYIIPASRMEGFWGGSLVNNLGTSFKLFGHYLKLVLFPYPLIADYSGNVFPISTGILEPSTVLAGLVTLAYLAIFLWLARAHPLPSFGLAWFALTLAPVLQIIPFHELAADHFLYLPMAGFVFFLGVVLDQLISAVQKPKFVWTGIGILSLVSVWVVVNRNQVWENPRTLWQTTIEQAPGSYRANVNLAQVLLQEGKTEEAIQLLNRGLEIDPDQAVAWTNLGFIYYQLGRQQRAAGQLRDAQQNLLTAVEHFKKALEMDSSDPVLLINLGTGYAELYRTARLEGRAEGSQFWLEKAEKTYAAVLKKIYLDKRRELFYVRRNLGGLFLDSNRPGLAVMHLERYVSNHPEDPTGFYLLGEAHIRLNQFKKAIESLEKSVHLQSNPDSLRALATAYERLGETDRAVETYQSAIKLSPDQPDLHFRLGQLYKKRGEVYFAIQEFQLVNRLDKTGRYRPLVAREIQKMTTSPK